ncbi:MAG: TIGR03067 domain-containing protein [Planctomycetaceae bacterium]|nr:TIGR03067 domain-containing protein [Planctomycetaceae bacterium]
MRLAHSGLVAVSLLIAGVSSWAGAAPRTWTDASGKFSIKAEFVEIKEGQVYLKKADDGEVIAVPVNQLSAIDRNFLANRSTAKPAAKPTADSTATPAANAPTGEPSPLKFVDADGNGKLSRSEWTALGQRFRTLDEDKDAALGEAELESTDAAELLLQLADADGDRKITRNEWAQLSQSFNRLDTTKDSALDGDELAAAAKTSQSRASGSASLAASSGPIVWRGSIEGRGQIELTVTGNQIVGREMGPGGPGRSLGSGTFTMTGDGRLGNMDAVYTDGPQRGQTCLGIYRLEGNTLVWCVSNRNGRRPQTFAGGNGDWLMTLTRAPTP